MNVNARFLFLAVQTPLVLSGCVCPQSQNVESAVYSALAQLGSPVEVAGWTDTALIRASRGFDKQQGSEGEI